VAVLLELALQLRKFKPKESIHFVAFANEECPGMPMTTMGSYSYARDCKKRDYDVRMIVLEMLGYFSNEKDSQKYPEPFKHLYPSTANFLGFASNWDSRELLYDCIRSFRKNACVPSEGIAAPGDLVEDITRSDHWGFWQFGYPAI